MATVEDYINNTKIVFVDKSRISNAESLNELLVDEYTVIAIDANGVGPSPKQWIRETCGLKPEPFWYLQAPNIPTWCTQYNCNLEIHVVDVVHNKYIVVGMAGTVGMRENAALLKTMIVDKLRVIDSSHMTDAESDAKYIAQTCIQFATKWTIPNASVLNRVLEDKNTVVVMQNFLGVTDYYWAEYTYQLTDGCHNDEFPNLEHLHVDMVEVGSTYFLVIAATDEDNTETRGTQNDHRLIKEMILASGKAVSVSDETPPCFEEREEYRRMTTIAFAKKHEIHDVETLEEIMWNRYTVLVMSGVDERWVYETYGGIDSRGDESDDSDESDEDCDLLRGDYSNDDECERFHRIPPRDHTHNGSFLNIRTEDGHVNMRVANVEVDGMQFLVIAAARMKDSRASPGIFDNLHLLKTMIHEELAHPKEIIHAVEIKSDSPFRSKWARNLRQFGAWYGNTDRYNKRKWEYEYEVSGGDVNGRPT
jgi:hypothetical protein